MTFFSTSQQHHSYISPSHSLGPAAYHIPSTTPKHRAYAPFGSTSQPKSNNPNPLGPGSYEIASDILQPNVKKYQSDKCVILKINDEGSVQFKSNTKRFNHQLPTTPGPGSYLPQPTRKNKSQSHHPKQNRYFTHQSPPQPVLFTDPPQPQPIPQQRQPRIKGAVNWSLNRKERFTSQQKQHFTEDHRAQIISQIRTTKNKRKKISTQNAVFKSRSAKSMLECSIYKTSNPYKMEIKKLIGYKDNGPAPGSYNLISTIKPNQLPHKFQFFGSTSIRFQQKSTLDQVGPGSYKPQLYQHSVKHKPPASLQQLSRSSYIQSDPNIPGPGAYQLYQNTPQTKNNGAFGSMQPRFAQIKTQPYQNKNEVIFGSEDIEREKKKEQQFLARKNLYTHKNNYFFKSSKERDCFEDVNKSTPFGEYNVTQNDISNKISKIEEIKNHFKDCNLERPAFLSSEDRFKDDKDQIIGHQDCWCRVKEVQRKSNPLISCHFRSKSKRIEVFDSKYKAPPIGQYDVKQTVIKQSFNAKFFKNSINKVKKLNIWKQAKNLTQVNK